MASANDTINYLMGGQQNKQVTVPTGTGMSMTAMIDSISAEQRRQTAYQKNLQSINVSNPKDMTARRMLGTIALIGESDPTTAKKLYSDFRYLQTEKSSQFYNPYTRATNKAFGYMQSLGYDIDSVDDEWLAANAEMKDWWVENNNDYGVKSPTKKSSTKEKLGYNYNQFLKAEETTKKAESEWDALQQELTYWAQQTDRNYSDEEILRRIDWSKYKTLQKLDDGRESGQPVELNRAIDYSEDAMYATLWAARNGGSTGDLWLDMANSSFGTGWQDDPTITAKRTIGSDDYSIYSLGSTMDEERVYFGTSGFDQKWLDDNRARYLGGNDETAKKMYKKVWDAEQYTQKLEGELDAMRSSIMDMVNSDFTAEDIITAIKSGETAYKDLFDLDESMLSGDIKNTTRAINYRWSDMEAYIRDAVEKKKGRDALNTVAGVFEATRGYGPLNPMFQTDTIGRYGKGNIDLYNRIPVVDDDGYTETVKSFSVNIDGKEVLLPSVIDGKIVSEDEAIRHFKETGEYLGVFDTVAEANKYAEDLHKQQEQLYTEQNETPLFSQTDMAMEEDTKRAYNSLNNTVRTYGTPAEKVALTTGKTKKYDFAAAEIRQYTADFRKSFSDSSTGLIVNDYLGKYSTVRDYETARDNRDASRAKLEETTEEWQQLSDRQTTMNSVGGLDETQFEMLQYITSMEPGELPELDWTLNRIRQNPNDRTALNSLYALVTGTSAEQVSEDDAFSSDSKVETARKFFDYIEGNKQGDFAPLTREERARLNELTKQREALEANIAEADAYLNANRRSYMDSRMDMMFMQAGYEAAAQQYKDMDPGLMKKIEYIFDIGNTKQVPSYYGRTTYDYGVENKSITREQATLQAVSDLSVLQSNLNSINSTMEYLDKIGVPMDDAFRRNIQVRKDELQKAALDAGYASLDGAKDFQSVIDAEIADDARTVDESNVMDLTLAKVYKDGVYTGGYLMPQEYASLSAISKEEAARYFYIKGTDGDEEARKYLDYLCDPESGILTVRKMENVRKSASDIANIPVIGGTLATALSFVTKLASVPSELIYRGKQAIEGKQVSPYNEAFAAREFTNTARQETKNAIVNASDQLFGKGNIISGVLGRTYSIGAGAIDMQIGSKLVNGILGAATPNVADLFPQSMTVRLAHSAAEVVPSTLDSAGETYRRALQTTGDETKAGMMYDVSLLSNLITHTIVMDGIHGALKTDPTAVKQGISGLLKNVLQTDLSVGGSTAVSTLIDEAADRAIMDADSQWQKDYDAYRKIYPSEVARQMADSNMWERVANNTVESVINATLRTLIIGGAPLAADKIRSGAQKMKNLWEGVKQVYKDEFIDPKDPDFMIGEDGEIYIRPDSDVMVKREKGYNSRTMTTGVQKVKLPEGFKANEYGATMVLDRTTNKPHEVIGYVENDQGGVDFIVEGTGERIPVTNILVKDENGTIHDMEAREFALMNEAMDWYFNGGAPVSTTAAPASSTSETSTAAPVNQEPVTGGNVNEQPALPDVSKDMTVLNQAYGADSTGAAVSLSGLFNNPDPAVTRAAGQTLVGGVSGNDPRVAVSAMQQILLKADKPDKIKDDVLAATLTNGQGRQALQKIIDKIREGKTVTKTDVRALHSGVYRDRKADPAGFNRTIQESTLESQRANKTVEIASQNEDVKKADDKVEEAQQSLDNANARLTTKKQEAKAAAKNLEEANKQFSGKKKSTRNSTQTAREHAIATKKDVNTANEQVEVQKQKLGKEKKARDEVQQKALTTAREEANAIVDEENAAREQENYDNAVARLSPTSPFVTSRNRENLRPSRGARVRTITAYDADGNPVTLTGVYDRIETGDSLTVENAGEENNTGAVGTTTVIFTTADGRLVMLNRGKYDSEGHLIREEGDVTTDDNEATYAADRMASSDANNTDAKHPEIAPKVYFPSSFPINVNGREIQMIGLAGKENLNGQEFPVIMGMDGKLYSTADPNVDVPFEKRDMVDETLDKNADSLEVVEAPRIEITGGNVNGDTGGRPESPGQANVPVQGIAGTGDQPGELAGLPGRDVGPGDNSDAGQGTGMEETPGRGEESPAEHFGPGESRSNEVLRRLIKNDLEESKTATDPGLVKGKDYGRFSSALDEAKKNNPHGLFVDPQSPEELEENGAVTFLSPDGMSGVAVETNGDKKGNIVGVFNNPKGGKKHTLPFLLTHAIAGGGTKLDCYGGYLSRSYEKFGFVPVARVPFNREFAPKGWNYERDGEPDVIVMMHNGDSPRVVAQRYKYDEADGGYHRMTDEEMANLPVFKDYFEALKFRNDLLAKQDKKNDLVVTHGLSAEHAEAALDAGGFASPSRAIVPKGQKNNRAIGWGDVIFFFGTNSADPEQHPDTTIYGGDAGTPRFPRNVEWDGSKFIDKETGKEVSLQGITDRMYDNAPESSGYETTYPTLDEAARNIGRTEGIGTRYGRSRRELEQQETQALNNAAQNATSSNERISSLFEKSSTIHEAYATAKTFEEARQLIKEAGLTVSDELLDEVETAIETRQSTPSLYLEEKRQGTVSTKESIGVLACEDEEGVIQKAKAQGIPVITYPRGKTRAETMKNKAKAYNAAVDMLYRTQDSRTTVDDEGNPKITPPDVNNGSGGTGLESIVNSFGLSASDHEGIPQMSDLTDANGVNFGYTFANKNGENVIGLSKEYDTPETREALEKAGYVFDAKSGEWVQQATPPDVKNLPTNPDVKGPATGGNVNGPQAVDQGNLTFNLGGSRPATGMGHRQWNNEGAQASDVLHQQTKDYLLANDLYMKDSNADQVDRALGWVKGHATQDDPSGFYGALAEIDSGNFNFWSKDGVIRLQTMIGMAATRGDVDTELRLADKYYSEVGTDLGQALQARKVFNLMTPTGRKQILRREAQKIQDEYQAQGKKLNLKISDETLDAAANARTEEEFENARRRMEQEIADQIPSDWRLRLRTIRMTSMLANPRTHIRNIFGNSFAIPMVEIKNAIATGLERMSGVPKGERTKAIMRSKESVAFALKDRDLMMPELQGTAKHYEMSRTERLRQAFGRGEGKTALGRGISKTLGKGYQKVADTSSNALEGEDKIFLGLHYVRALSGWMTANGYTPEDMKGKTLDKGRAYAILEAQKATYRDPNTLATWLNNQSNKPAAAQWVINAVQPFIKTPANIMRRGFEYSPLGLARSVLKSGKQLQAYKDWEDSGFKGPKPKNAKSPSEVFDSVAAGMTGTMLAGLGAWLASLGVLRVKANDTDILHGAQDYSLEIGGKSIGIGSVIPANIPVLLGGSLYDAAAKMKKNGSVDMWEVLNAVSDVFEPVIDTTMMTSLNSLLDTSKYTKEGTPVGALAEKIVANYVASYMPSFVGAVARTVDPTMRKTFIESSKNESKNIWMTMFEQTQNKIPFLSKDNVPYINAWGEANRLNPGVMDYFSALMENFILPDKIQDLTDDELDRKLEELAGTVGDSVKPGSQEKSLPVNGERINLNDQQWYQYNSTKGKTSKAVLQELIERPEFICLNGSPEVQAELVKKVYKYANAKAALELFPDKNITEAWTRDALKADNVVDYIFQKEEESAKKESISTHRASLCTSVEGSNYEAAKTDLAFLRQAGVKDSSIKNTLTTHFKPLYKEASENYDDEEMGKIRAMLISLGLGYENYKPTDWEKWTK